MAPSVYQLGVACLMASTALANPAAPITLRQTGTFVPRPGYFPATGDDTIAGGIFCISLPIWLPTCNALATTLGRRAVSLQGGKAPSLKVPAHTQRK
ncbi:alpha/beta-Hydrolase [Apiospora arundinis]